MHTLTVRELAFHSGSALDGPYHSNVTTPYPVILSEALQDWRQILK